MGELGSLLTRAREARGLTLEDAERDTRISRRYLAALEAEQFEVIPAPVYARGFLRSYSQYLGLDPQEMLAMFPREEDEGYGRSEPVPERPSMDRPISPVSASRPTWRARPGGQPPERGPMPGVRGAARAGEPVIGRAPAPRQPVRPDEWEPVIGIDVGVPTPARRLDVDPAAQTRSAVIAIVAIVAILGVVFVAYLLAGLAADDGASPPGTLGQTPTATATTAAGPSGLQVTPGIVPDVRGVQEATAVAAIREAGYEPLIQRVRSNQPAGMVIDQSPAPEVEMAQGSRVQIVVSEGP